MIVLNWLIKLDNTCLWIVMNAFGIKVEHAETHHIRSSLCKLSEKLYSPLEGTVREFYVMFTDVTAILRMMSFIYSKLLKGVKKLLKMFAFVY